MLFNKRSLLLLQHYQNPYQQPEWQDLYLRFQVLIKINTKIMLFWDMKSCSLGQLYHCFQGNCYLTPSGWNLFFTLCFWRDNAMSSTYTDQGYVAVTHLHPCHPGLGVPLQPLVLSTQSLLLSLGRTLQHCNFTPATQITNQWWKIKKSCSSACH